MKNRRCSKTKGVRKLRVITVKLHVPLQVMAGVSQSKVKSALLQWGIDAKMKEINKYAFYPQPGIIFRFVSKVWDKKCTSLKTMGFFEKQWAFLKNNGLFKNTSRFLDTASHNLFHFNSTGIQSQYINTSVGWQYLTQ